MIDLNEINEDNKHYIDSNIKENASDSLEFCDKSLAKTIIKNVIEGKYDKARRIVKIHKNNQSLDFKSACAILECVENNFNAGRKLYTECLADSQLYTKSMLSLARLDIQTHNYDKAREKLIKIISGDYLKEEALIELIILNIFEKKYKEAKTLLKYFSTDLQIKKRIKNNYQFLNIYLKILQNELKPLETKYNLNMSYICNRLFNSSDKLLLNHINKHYGKTNGKDNGYFFDNIDCKKLLIDAKERIQDMNGNHFTIADTYKYRLEDPIGIIGNEVTYDLCVTTIIGTKDIITMYPVALSDEFDKEGFTYNKK